MPLIFKFIPKLSDIVEHASCLFLIKHANKFHESKFLIGF